MSLSASDASGDMDTAQMRSQIRRYPALFPIREDTYMRAFMYASLVAAITTGLVLEYRFVNPFGTYADSGDSNYAQQRHPHVIATVQTMVVTFIVWAITLVLLHVLFSLGDSSVAGEQPFH